MNPKSVRLSSEYFELLSKSEEDRDYLIAHKNEIPGDKFNILLGHADQDITFLRSKINEIGMTEKKSEDVDIKTDVKHEVTASKIESGLTITDGAIIFVSLIGGPLILTWLMKNPRENIKTTYAVLKALRGVASALT